MLSAQQYNISLKRAATETEAALKAFSPFDSVIEDLEAVSRLAGFVIRPAGVLAGLDMSFRVGHQGEDTP
jgi:hypothetical protein